MLAYFPTIYPGELLYSVLARYHRHTGGESPSRTNEALFGERHVMASPDFPGHLATLAARIPKRRGLTVETLIERTTLYPYYTAFEPSAVRAGAREAMTVGSTEGLHLALGLATFRAGRVTTLRFCPACQQTMLTEVGELYWRRDQQLPGVLVCPEHGTPLFESQVALATHNRHVFIAADRANCPRNSRPLMARFDERTRERLQAMARRSAAVLEGSIEPRTFAGWSTFYRAWMMRVGLARSPQKLDQQQLETEFRAYYGAALQVLPAVMDDGRLRGEWLAAMVRKHRHAMHPLYHLLLQDFLAAREPVPVMRPFGEGPWPCRNPLARHRGQAVVIDCHEHRDGGRIIGRFSCACGFVYARSFDPETGMQGPARFRRYGALLAPELKRSIEAGVSLRALSSRLELDPKTVVGLAQEMGIPVPWHLKSTRHRSCRTPRVSGALPEHTRPATVTGSHTSPQRASHLRDWLAIDAAWAERISRTAAGIRALSPPVRVSLAEIERRIGTRGWLDKRQEKLPRCMSVLAQLTESIPDFQRRRIDWAIDVLTDEHELVVPWRVLRKAGLRSGHQGCVVAALHGRRSHRGARA